MGTIRKIGDDYYIEFVARGLRYQRNGGKDKAAAESLLEDIEGQIQKGEMSIDVHDIKADAFFQEVLGLLRDEHTPKTFSHYKVIINDFKQFLSGKFPENFKLSKVTPSIIEDYRAYLVKEAKDSVNFILVLLSDIMDYAISLGHLNDNPTLHARFVDIPCKDRPKIFGDDQIEQLCKEASGDVKNTLILLLNTGMHCEEIAALKWNDIDFRENIVTVNKRKIPMNSEVLSVLKRYDQNKEPVFSDVTQESFEPIAQKCGLDVSQFLSTLRHTFAKNVLEKGVSLVGLYKLLGLADIRDIMVYASFSKRNELG